MKWKSGSNSFLLPTQLSCSTWNQITWNLIKGCCFPTMQLAARRLTLNCQCKCLRHLRRNADACQCNLGVHAFESTQYIWGTGTLFLPHLMLFRYGVGAAMFALGLWGTIPEQKTEAATRNKKKKIREKKKKE